MESHFNKNTELQSTIQNSSKLHQRCSHEGVLKLLHRKVCGKISRKMYVVDFPFNKIARLNSSAYYWIKKLHYRCFSEKCIQRRECSNISTISKKTFTRRSLFSNVTRLQFRVSSLAKNTPSKMFPVPKQVCIEVILFNLLK